MDLVLYSTNSLARVLANYGVHYMYQHYTSVLWLFSITNFNMESCYPQLSIDIINRVHNSCSCKCGSWIRNRYNQACLTIATLLNSAIKCH